MDRSFQTGERIMEKTNQNASLFSEACQLLFDQDEFELKNRGLLLLEKATEQNNSEALCILGDFCLYGKKELVRKDVQKSTVCYIRAWNLTAPFFEEEYTGCIDWSYAANVCLRMGMVFLYGRSMAEDYEMAEMFFENACYGFDSLIKNGNPKAEKNLKKAQKFLLSARTKKPSLPPTSIFMIRLH